MAGGLAKLEWDQTAILWSLTANLNRDPKQKPEPFHPSDIHPYRTAADYQTDDDCRKVREAIKRTCKVRRLQNVNVVNRSGESVPPAPGR